MTESEDKKAEVEETPEAEVEATPVAETPADDAPEAEVAADEEPVVEETAPAPVAEAKPKAKKKAAPKAAPVAEESKPKRGRSRGRKGEDAKVVPVGLEVSAHAKYVRTSARKARLVCDHIRGKDVTEARAI